MHTCTYIFSKRKRKVLFGCTISGDNRKFRGLLTRLPLGLFSPLADAPVLGFLFSFFLQIDKMDVAWNLQSYSVE